MRVVWTFLSLFCLTAGRGLGWTLINLGIEGWPTRQLTVYVNPTACPLSEATLMDLVDRSLDVWNGVPTASISLVRAAENSTLTAEQFLQGGASEVPVILCDPDFDVNVGSAHVVPAATYCATGPVLNTGAIFLNTDVGTGAEISTMSLPELRIIIAHEMGHILGLGHSSQPEALMYYSVSGKDDARLTDDDIQGLSYLYPRTEFGRGAFGCASAHQSGGNPAAFALCAVFMLGLLLLGRFWVSIRAE